MAIHISFHDHNLIEVKAINDELTTLKIYDNDRPYGSEVTFYFSNPTEVIDWANKIATQGHKINKKYVLDKLGV
jgi:hypothetical protein